MSEEQSKGRILIVDDDVVCARTLHNRLSAEGYQVQVCRHGSEAIQFLSHQVFDVAVIEVILPGIPAVRLLEQSLKLRPSLKAIMIAAVGNIDTAVDLMKRGALDYLRKPLDFELLCEKIHECISEDMESRAAGGRGERKTEHLHDFYAMIGRCDPMRQIYTIIEKVAGTNASVLITGESGTGKELVAQTIHEINPRTTGRFVTVNCGAIPESLLESEMFGHMRGSFTGAVKDTKGLFDVADGGTVFLDEIGNIGTGLQVKLLRVLQDGEFKPVGSTTTRRVDLRILAATNTNLMEAVQEQRFRDDLYYRLNVVSIHLPPLRERAEDIELLVDHLVGEISAELSRPKPAVTGEFLEGMKSYSWPGNIRELRNILERIIILTGQDTLGLDQVPGEILRLGKESRDLFRLSYAEAKRVSEEVFSREYLERALRRTRGNVSRAATLCGLNRQSLHRMLNRYRIDPKGYRGSGAYAGSDPPGKRAN